MNDSRDLKAIAEACQQHQPLRFMRSHGALYIRNDNGIVFDVHQNRSFPEFMAQNNDYADLVLAANPATVLALIAENDSSRKHWQNESNNVQALMVEVARLKAEIAGLKTGYEAYEQVVQGLKAENEALRNAALSKAVVWCACGDGHPANSYGAGFMDANGGVCANCDAAVGSGLPDSRGSEQGQTPTETPVPERSACRSENP